MTVGIPRSLLYYKHFPFWNAFFSGVGADIVVSKPTTKGTLDAGVKACVQDVCLPIKVALGHTIEVARTADFVFLPRYLSLEPGTYSCPKIVAFTDMAKGTVENFPPVLDPVVDLNEKRASVDRAFLELGKRMGAEPGKARRAVEDAKDAQKAFDNEVRANGTAGALAGRGMLGFAKSGNKGAKQSPAGRGYSRSGRALTVGVLGRPYCLYDSILSVDLLDRLTACGVSTVTTDSLSYSDISAQLSTLPFDLYWLSAREIVGGAYVWLDRKMVDGIIYLIPFQCGPDALLSVLVSGRAGQTGGIPYMPLIVDEHTGESGIVTRLEAFLDMLARK